MVTLGLRIGDRVLIDAKTSSKSKVFTLVIFLSLSKLSPPSLSLTLIPLSLTHSLPLSNSLPPPPLKLSPPPPSLLPQNGTIRFGGSTEFAVGQWAGIELEEAIGKNDGSCMGIRYFTCKPKYGT